MILLDTNVISELMRAEPAQAVLDWFGQHDAADLFISAVTEAELRAGIAYLPEGQRRDRLQVAVDAMIDQDFLGRILPSTQSRRAPTPKSQPSAPRAAQSLRLTARSRQSPAQQTPPCHAQRQGFRRLRTSCD